MKKMEPFGYIGEFLLDEPVRLNLFLRGDFIKSIDFRSSQCIGDSGREIGEGVFLYVKDYQYIKNCIVVKKYSIIKLI